MAKEKATQCAVILAHLKANGTITGLEAVSKYRIMRLAARISDLRRQGVNIVTDTAGDGNYAVYRLAEEG